MGSSPSVRQFPLTLGIEQIDRDLFEDSLTQSGSTKTEVGQDKQSFLKAQKAMSRTREKIKFPSDPKACSLILKQSLKCLGKLVAELFISTIYPESY